MKFNILVAIFAFLIMGGISFSVHRKVDKQEDAVKELKEEVKPITPPVLHRAPVQYPSEPEVAEAYAAGSEDRKGVFFLEQHGLPIKYTLLDPSLRPVERGWAYYDPQNKTWVVEIDGYRFGLK